MTKHFKFIATLLFIFVIAGQTIYGQNKAIIFINNLNAYSSKIKPKDTLLGLRFFKPKINEITLNPDSTFEFWSRPNVSCFSWHNYKGTWRKNNDTIYFNDNYEIVEIEYNVTYKKDSINSYIITFTSDKNSDFKDKEIKVQYIYDYDSHLENIEKVFKLKSSNLLEIPFNEIPDLKELTSIRAECQFNYEKRRAYITDCSEKKYLNKKGKEIPNIINVEYIEKPKKEIVYRTIKGVLNKNKLVIVSITKSKTLLPDHNKDILFEDNYTLMN